MTHFTIKDDQVIDLNPARAQAPASDHAKDSTDYEDENDSTIGELKLPCLPTIRLYQPSASTIHPSLPPILLYHPSFSTTHPSLPPIRLYHPSISPDSTLIYTLGNFFTTSLMLFSSICSKITASLCLSHHHLLHFSCQF